MALEAALALPLVGLVLAAVLGTTTVVVDQLVVTRAARAAARAVAVSGDRSAAATVVASTTPTARATVRVRRGLATVTVTLVDDVMGVAYGVDATAVAPLEPAVTRPAQRR